MSDKKLYFYKEPEKSYNPSRIFIAIRTKEKAKNALMIIDFQDSKIMDLPKESIKKIISKLETLKQKIYCMGNVCLHFCCINDKWNIRVEVLIGNKTWDIALDMEDSILRLVEPEGITEKIITISSEKNIRKVMQIINNILSNMRVLLRHSMENDASAKNHTK